MTTKQKLKLFVPPLFYRIRSKIKYGGRVFADSIDLEQCFVLFMNELNDRYDVSLTDIEHLTRVIPDSYLTSLSTSGSYEANAYGMFYVLQKYIGNVFYNKPPKNFAIQHGILYELTNFDIAKREKINFVWSPYIEQMFRQHTHNKDIYSIGAPFLYAKSNLSPENIKNERLRLGKNLLAFPMHSCWCVDKVYDPMSFIELLKEQKKKFDSVRVCLYWKDVLNGTTKVYQDAGFECVSCGHYHDQFFLERLHSLIEISDATISNAIGSHIGFSIYLNKPHWLRPDSFDLVDKFDSVEGKEEMDLINTSKNYQEIYNAFLDNEIYDITDNQRQVVDKYWGLSSRKSPEDLRELIRSFY